MSFRTSLIRHGNLNRIEELYAAGFGPYAIAGIFRDGGVEIDGGDVASIIRSGPALESKPLPKVVVAAHIRAAKLALKPT